MPVYLFLDLQMRQPSDHQLSKATESYCFYLSFFSGYKITDEKSAHPQCFTSYSTHIFQLCKSCWEESSSCKDGVGGLSCSSLSLLEGFFLFFAFQLHSVYDHVPSRSSFSKLVPCWDLVPCLSTTASSSFFCRTQKEKIWNIIQCIVIWKRIFFMEYYTNVSWT